MNMKKEYIMPEVNVVKIHTERMLAGGSDPDTVESQEGNDATSGTIGARENFFWDSDYSEEE